MTDDERSELLAQLADGQEKLLACQERLAAYIEVVADVVERLGHEGSEPSDLLDALGEIEGMLTGKITNEPHDLAGLAEVCRLALWHRDRGRLLLTDARETCDRRAAERDAAILERDAAAREITRMLALHAVNPATLQTVTAQPPQPIILDKHGTARFKKNTVVEWVLDNGGIDLNRIVLRGFNADDMRQFYQLIGYSVGGYADLTEGSSDPRLAAFDAAVEQL